MPIRPSSRFKTYRVEEPRQATLIRISDADETKPYRLVHPYQRIIPKQMREDVLNETND